MSEVNHALTFSKLVKQCQYIIIPQLQRDYAQGRESEQEVRNTFLNAICAALDLPVGHPTLPINLDFIYGTMETEGGRTEFLPLDGQQRLTTLFLLHWYLAWSDEQLTEFKDLVWDGKHSRFSYKVRPSSGEFFDNLVNYVPASKPVDYVPASKPNGDGPIKRLLEDQSWFFLYWRLDPTIQSCLTMLDAIHTHFNAKSGLYARLVDENSPAIIFQLLQLEHFGLSDDLYIKMNARGKPLTAFETFKAMVEKHIGEAFPEPNVYKLNDNQVSLKEYFSHHIDTKWADLFWPYRDMTTNLFDDRIMNLIHCVGIVTCDDEDHIKELWNSAKPLSFHKYRELKRLDASHIKLLITLFNAWCDGMPNNIKTHLPDSVQFDEQQVFKKIIEGAKNTGLILLLQFYAYAKFLQEHGLPVNKDRFVEWMRIIKNLTVNTDIDRIDSFLSAISSIKEMVKHSGDILVFLTDKSNTINFFREQQVNEERIKAALILKSNHWKDAILEAEQHKYFNGQIEFLFDFANILELEKTLPVKDWPEEIQYELRVGFQNYFEKAKLMFDNDDLSLVGFPFRWERALLSVGDYLIPNKKESGKYYSFLTKEKGPQDTHTWKRLLRGGDSSLVEKRAHLKILWNSIKNENDTAEQEKQLDKLIEERQLAIPNDDWRKAVITCPEAIKFCDERWIHKSDPANEVYLLKPTKMQGYHAELYSYKLYIDLIKHVKDNADNLVPFQVNQDEKLGYEMVKGTYSEPYARIFCPLPVCNLELRIFSKNGCFNLDCTITEKNDEYDERMLYESLRYSEGISNFSENEGGFSAIISRGDVFFALNNMASSLRNCYRI
jgi:hypothetical protein